LSPCTGDETSLEGTVRQFHSLGAACERKPTGDRGGDSHPHSVESPAYRWDILQRTAVNPSNERQIRVDRPAVAWMSTLGRGSPVFMMPSHPSMCPSHQPSDFQYSTLLTARYRSSCSADTYTDAPDCNLSVDVH
jgi:hypothetical protein